MSSGHKIRKFAALMTGAPSSVKFLTHTLKDIKHLIASFATPRLCVESLGVLALLIGSCAPQSPATPIMAPSPTPIPHAPEIRFGLVGEPTDENVWALFDEQGASYANYALRSEYWPRLYTLSIPDREFTAMAAQGMPSPITREGDRSVGTVSLRKDLSWTDGTPFTADDVAFTVNSALSFELGFDWKAYYNTDVLNRAIAVDGSTVKFYFTRQPDVGHWQYGPLQGPIVQKAYWEPKVIAAAALLPDDALPALISETEAQRAGLQQEVDELNARFLALQQSGKQDRELEMELKRKQGDLDEANNKLAELNDEYAAQSSAARAALYALDDKDEPTLGTWMPAGVEDGVWTNAANPDFPFGRTNFDRATYRAYPDEPAAITALKENVVDVILTPGGISSGGATNTTIEDPGLHLVENGTARAHFLVINPSNPALKDSAFRKVLSCSITRVLEVGASTGRPLLSVVPPGSAGWQDLDAPHQCKGSTPPETGTLPELMLLAPTAEIDPQAAEVAVEVQQAAQALGIGVTVAYAGLEDIRYAIFSSGQYDMALMGWRLAAYPGYLCEWFGEGAHFDYGSEALRSECVALEGESDLEAARQHFYEIQSILAEDLPFIPLYTEFTYDTYRNVSYPFEEVLDGLSGLYGAPSLAIPSP